jgi:hypothetical protein
MEARAGRTGYLIVHATSYLRALFPSCISSFGGPMSFPQDVWFWNYFSLLCCFLILLFLCIWLIKTLERGIAAHREQSRQIQELQRLLMEELYPSDTGDVESDENFMTQEMPVPQFKRLRDFATPQEPWEEELGGQVW